MRRCVLKGRGSIRFKVVSFTGLCAAIWQQGGHDGKRLDKGFEKVGGRKGAEKMVQEG